MSAGLKFKQAIANNKPLQVVGTVNAYCAMMAEKTVTKHFTSQVRVLLTHHTACQI